MPKKTPQTYTQFMHEYMREVKYCLDNLDKKKISQATEYIMQAYNNKRTVFVMGNGGSASTASHIACDFGKGTLQRHYDETEPRIKVISLTDNVALMTAFANDVSFEDIFFQQLRSLVEPNDVIIAISGSGNSKNVIKAVRYAKKCGAKVIGLLGFKTGGKLAQMVDCAINVKSDFYGPCEDIHLIINHMMTSWISKLKSLHEGKTNVSSENHAVPFKIIDDEK